MILGVAIEMTRHFFDRRVPGRRYVTGGKRHRRIQQKYYRYDLKQNIAHVRPLSHTTIGPPSHKKVHGMYHEIGHPIICGRYSFHISVSEGFAIEKRAALRFGLFQLEAFDFSGECVSSPAEKPGCILAMAFSLIQRDTNQSALELGEC